jgi:hypothetical protein
MSDPSCGCYFAWDPREDPEFAPLIVGRGSIGGKGRSLLFALRRLRDSHDELLTRVGLSPSRYLGVGVFEDFLSDIPRLDSLLAEADPEAIERTFLATSFPSYVSPRLEEFLAELKDPIVVRSSSLLEDSLKHSFAGKYLSTFILNREGSLSERVRAVEREIKRIYSRTFFPTAVSYRTKHGLGNDEMGILVMRIAGKWRGRYYYPTTGGVAFSRNVRRWTTRIRMEDGVLRFVFGLGTMSTKRGYARTFSLTNPLLRPEGPNPYKIMRHAQESFHVIDAETGGLTTLDIKKVWKDLLPHHPDLGIYAQLYTTDGDEGYFTSVDCSTEVPDSYAKICFTFEDFPRRCRNFFTRMKSMLPLLESEMGTPADLEYAYEPREDYLELVQSRPLWLGDRPAGVRLPDLSGRRVILRADRMVTDGAVEEVPLLIYVDHRIYAKTPDFHAVARALGAANRAAPGKYVLVAPGRVGSSNPELGVPVQYNELTQCACIVELGIPRSGHMPELSYGTHFFSDLETDDVLYMPVYEGEKNNIYDELWFDSTPYEKGEHPAIRIYRGDFSVFMESTTNSGVVLTGENEGPP